jgi:putative ABC transport system permease protein
VFGLAPLFSLSSRSLYAELKEGGSNSSASAGRLRLRRVLVGAEMAIALVLLTGAGLMLKSFARMYAHPAGFEPEKIGTMKVFLSGPAYSDGQAKLEYSRRVIGRLSHTPGIEAAAVTSASGTGPARVEGITFPDGQAPQVRFREASAGYARVVGLSLIAGRWTTDDETAPAVMVNESFVRRVFAGQEPLGRRVLLQELNNRPAPIVGVVGDLKIVRLDADPEPEVLIPYQETDSFRRLDILFKTPGAAQAVLHDFRRTVQSLDSTQPPSEVRTLEDALAESIAPFRFDLLLLGTFAAVAVVLALIGIYGVMSYTVTQRTREIGVRIALGARRGEIARMMLWQGMKVSFSGIAGGTVGALMVTRLITALLYDVKPNDPAIFAVAVTGLAGTCLLASWVPALKAARVEPLQALRHE